MIEQARRVVRIVFQPFLEIFQRLIETSQMPV